MIDNCDFFIFSCFIFFFNERNCPKEDGFFFLEATLSKNMQNYCIVSIKYCIFVSCKLSVFIFINFIILISIKTMNYAL